MLTGIGGCECRGCALEYITAYFTASKLDLDR